MAKKRRGDKPQRELTKRQLSRWQEQKKRQRIILGAGIFTIAAVLVIMLAGWYTSQYRPLHATAIRVNDAKFDMQYYIGMLRIQGRGQPSQYMSLIADMTVRGIEQSELIRQRALQLGITANNDNVTQKLKSSGFPNDSVHRDLVGTQLLTQKVRDEYLAKQVPASAKQARIMAMLLESEQQATEVRARLEKRESFADLAGQLSLDSLSKEKKGDLGWHTQDAFASLLGSKIPGDYAFGSEAGVLSQPRRDEDISKKVGYWLIKVVSQPGTNEATVNVMLLGSEREAQDVRARLTAGESFVTLAKEFSQLSNAKDNGGELGVVSKGDMGTAFDKFAFDPGTKAGALSESIRDDAQTTKGGYWLIQVLEKADDRPIEDSDRELLKNKALDDWVASLWGDSNNRIDDSYLDSGKKQWAVTRALKS